MFGRNFVVFLCSWTIIIGIALCVTYVINQKLLIQVAYTRADAYFIKDVIFRSWMSEHGGVYAPVTQNNPPNSYLSGFNEREISTPSGKELTLINPAYMNRQVYELAEKKFNIHSHITSLSPIRIENKADAWESKALMAFAREHKKEVYAITPFKNQEPYFRFMRPLYVETACLKCHAYQGYRAGDIRGGISVSIPIKDIKPYADIDLTKLFKVFGIIWFCGLLFFIARSKNHLFRAYRETLKLLFRKKQRQNYSEKIVLLGDFTTFFIPLLLMTTMILCVPLWFEYKSRVEILKNNHLQYIEDMQDSMLNNLHTIVSDVLILSSYPELFDFIENNEAYKQQIEKRFLSFSLNKGLYDQVRYIDKEGNELIRVDYRRGMPGIVSKEKLQNKKHRYYFTEAMQLNKGDVYISPMDLNVEHKQIEHPLKPVIRFATPIFDRKGDKQGILILNYLGERLIYNMVKQYHFEEGIIMLINENSFWLKGEAPEDEWGFMYPEKKKLMFKNRYPDAWKEIRYHSDGQYNNEDGLFTFSSVFPQLEIINNSLSYTYPLTKNEVSLEIKKQSWKIISFVPKTALDDLLKQLVIYSLPIYIIVVVILFFTSWRLAISKRFKIKSNQKLKATLAQVKELSITDDLTNLYNRRYFNQSISREMLRSRRINQQLVFCIFDIDFFKLYNDSYGHQAGDEVLKVIGQLLKNELSRASDHSFRLGGEEFGILAIVENKESAYHLINRIRNAIENQKIPHKKNKASDFVTASFGCFMIDANGDYTVNTIYRSADEALYRAKQEGRNRVVFY